MQSLQLVKNGIKDILFLALLFTHILQDAIIKGCSHLTDKTAYGMMGSTYQLLPTKTHKKRLLGVIKAHAVLNDFWTTTHSFNYTFGR